MAIDHNPIEQLRRLRERRAAERAQQYAITDTQPIQPTTDTTTSADRQARGGLGRGLLLGAAAGALVAFAIPAFAGGDGEPTPQDTTSVTADSRVPGTGEDATPPTETEPLPGQEPAPDSGLGGPSAPGGCEPADSPDETPPETLPPTDPAAEGPLLPVPGETSEQLPPPGTRTLPPGLHPGPHAGPHAGPQSLLPHPAGPGSGP